MTCDERQDLLLLYAGGLLDADEREPLHAHLLTGCPACAGAFAEAQATLAQMAAAVTPVTPPATAVERLMLRIGQGETPTATPIASSASTSSASLPARARSTFITALLASAAAVLITSGLWFYLMRDARSFWRSKNLQTIALVSSTQPNARGQVWWDRDRQQWRVTVTNLGPAPAGREYELWFIPAGGAPLRSQTFRVDRAGTSTLIVDVPASVGQLATAAITDEPFGGTDAPTGQIHLAGEFK